MSREWLISIGCEVTKAASVENGRLIDLYVETNSLSARVGNIYSGKITRMVPSLHGAFVEIGESRTAFLHESQINKTALLNSGVKILSKDKSMNTQLYAGQKIGVQIMKCGWQDKGPRLDCQIMIGGRYLVYMPYSSSIGVSKKIKNIEQRKLLVSRLEECIDCQKDHSGGYVLRTQAQIATRQELLNDINYLTTTWNTVKNDLKNSNKPRLLYQEIPLALRVLRDHLESYACNVFVDNADVFHQMQNYAKNYSNELINNIQLLDEDEPLLRKYDIDSQIKQSLNRKVTLQSGGYIIFDQCEAMTVIDVNSGSNVGNSNIGKLYYETNLEAVTVIAQQIRIRNISGIIIIDFIDMLKQQEKLALIKALKSAVKHDPITTKIKGMSSLGLIEMTRKRVHESISAILSERCPHCQGTGSLFIEQ